MGIVGVECFLATRCWIGFDPKAPIRREIGFDPKASMGQIGFDPKALAPITRSNWVRSQAPALGSIPSAAKPTFAG